MKRLKNMLTAGAAVFSFGILCAQESATVYTLSLQDVIHIAQTQSIDAMVAKNVFLSSYWQYRSFKADRLPSLNLSGEVADFDRSLRLLQNSTTGDMNYVENYNLQNSLQLFIQQKVSLTGGTLSLYSSLSRLDQFGANKSKTYYSQPVSISYIQPLFAYNSFKWDKKIEPHKFDRAKRIYIESMEEVTIKAVTRFFNFVLQKNNYDIAVQNYKNTKTMYAIAAERLKVGSVKKDELLQLELRMLNDSLAINQCDMNLKSQQMLLNSFLGYNESVSIVPVIEDDLPDLVLDYRFVLDKALANSSFVTDNLITQLEAEAAIAQARANRGATASITSRFGLSSNGSNFKTAYRDLLDQEVVGLSFSIPILDWGMGRGRVKVAEAQAETVKNRLAQAEIDYKHDIYVSVVQFNNQRNQCTVSRKASEIAEQRYRMTMENFAGGTISVTELNTAQTEKDQANSTYIQELYNYWLYYYGIRKSSLFDYRTGTDISAEFDKLAN